VSPTLLKADESALVQKSGVGATDRVDGHGTGAAASSSGGQ